MYFDILREFGLSLTSVTESFPFDSKTLVLKVSGKMFLLMDIDEQLSYNVKCDPEKAEELRERHFEIQPGWHMSKKHWNTISFEGSLSKAFHQEQVLNSYNLVRNSLTKLQKTELNELESR